MGFFLLLFFTIGWVAAMVFLARKIGVGFRRTKTVKTVALASALILLPYAQELYIYYGFHVYCETYAITKLEPVETDSLSYDIVGIDPKDLLDHPALNHIYYRGSTARQEEPVSTSLVRDPVSCQDIASSHKDKTSQLNDVDEAVAPIATALCYSNSPLLQEPKFLLTYGDRVEGSDIKAPNAYWFFPEVKVGATYIVVEVSTNTVKSRYARYFAKPGYLTRALSPMFRNYTCPGDPYSITDRASFPYGNIIFQFLEKAILKAN